MLTLTAHGRIGRDAELRRLDDGGAVLDLAVACNYGRKGADGYKPSQWVKATLWGKQAEALAPYLTKGKGVALILRDVHVREFAKKDGPPGTSLDGTVIEIEFTGAGPREEAAAPAPARTVAPPRQSAKPAPADYDDQDIPF